MANLVERYIHQVGRYLPPKERAEIEAELRSQIQDQMDDRFEGTPSQEDIAAVLLELGDPRQMAVSYSSDKYLVGPELYPFMMLVLRYGWLLIPAMVIFLNIFGVLTSTQRPALFGWLIETLLAVLQTGFIFTGVVVIFFAAVQHSGEEIEKKQEFNPLNLPEVDDPAAVDRTEATIGVAFGLFGMLVLLFFLRVGGLTLRFNLSDPGEGIPAPAVWLLLSFIVVFVMVILNFLALRRSRWSFGMLLAQTILEVFGSICMYFAVYVPVYERIIASNPSLATVPFVDKVPQMIAVIIALLALLDKGIQLVRIWNYRNSGHAPLTTQTDQ